MPAPCSFCTAVELLRVPEADGVVLLGAGEEGVAPLFGAGEVGTLLVVGTPLGGELIPETLGDTTLTKSGLMT